MLFHCIPPSSFPPSPPSPPIHSIPPPPPLLSSADSSPMSLTMSSSSRRPSQRPSSPARRTTELVTFNHCLRPAARQMWHLHQQRQQLRCNLLRLLCTPPPLLEAHGELVPIAAHWRRDHHLQPSCSISLCKRAGWLSCPSATDLV